MVKVNTLRLVADARTFHKFENRSRGKCLVLLWSLVLGIWSLLKQTRDFSPGQCQNTRLLRAVIERAKSANLLEATHGIESVEKLGVTRGQFGRFEIAVAEIEGMEGARIFGGEKVESEPAPIGPRNLLRLPKECDEQQQDEISVDARLELQVPGEIFRGDLAFAFLELERGVKSVVDLLDEGNERPDIAIAQAGAGIVALELFNQPARIINADIKLIVGPAEKSAGEFAQLARIRPGQARKLGATALIDQAIFQVNPDLRVGALKEALDLAEERLVHDRRCLIQRSQRFTTGSKDSFLCVPLWPL